MTLFLQVTGGDWLDVGNCGAVVFVPASQEMDNELVAVTATTVLVIASCFKSETTLDLIQGTERQFSAMNCQRKTTFL